MTLRTASGSPTIFCLSINRQWPELARLHPPPAAAEKTDDQGAAKGLSAGLDAAAADLCSLRLTGKTEDGRKSASGTVRAAALLALRYLEAKVKGDTVQAEALQSAIQVRGI